MTQRLDKFILAMIISCIVINAYALSSDRRQKAHLSANKVTYNRLQHLSTYNGNIKMQQGTTRFSAEHMQIFDTNQNKIYKVIASGNPARYSVLPDHKKYRLQTSADVIKYYPIKGIAMLIGHAQVTQHQNKFSGPLIIYNSKQQTVIGKGSSHNQTTIVIQP